jgi:hypothetical protein
MDEEVWNKRERIENERREKNVNFYNCYFNVCNRNPEARRANKAFIYTVCSKSLETPQ